ncbi:hypothetical protein GUJ93_ZPchr0006g41482 [Zizania palustris]|uniref:Nucleolar 27S pre-rRNA processing Urb2/Npa2 C-terminal domain-containing protein n=1 Tax=Zizania palustris TaxID=103762 RepID=A0A8J5W3S8_ZIZPA|nr:hypothetical protein GUJ93_ZPchr0006g41482 [Zizania palustris]
MLKSINEILTTVIEEKIYVPTEDTSEGSNFKFLQDIYRVLILIAEKIYEFWVSASHLDDTSIKKMLPLIFAEIVDAIGHFLEIEYKVMGRDLVKLWLMVFALSAINESFKDIKPCFLLASKISGLSAQVICTFSELRQVSFSIFTLCGAVRMFRASVGAGSLASSFSASSLSSDKCLESLATLLSSHTLRDAIRTSINSMPEGQSSRCIEELTLDLTDTLKWMETCGILDANLKAHKQSSLVSRDSVFSQKAELLGRHLSEIYTNVLESITVTTSNSTLVAKSVERLVDAIRPNLCHLVRNESNSSSEFVYSVIGKHISNKQRANWQKIPSLPWLYVFFFRIYMSCKSLYQQSSGLMPPDLVIEATKLMGNSIIVCCGKEWTNSANILTEGYFAWIAQNSISLFDVIESLTQSLPRSCAGFPLLVFTLHVMALQRLNDLNRQINAFDFLLEDGTNQFDKENTRDAELLQKASCLEASRLASFMMSYVRLLSSGEIVSFQCYEITASWDLSLSSLDKFSFSVATWRLLCENIDMWSSHAAKKDLKNFFSNLIKFSFVQKWTCKHIDDSGSQSSYQETTLHNVSVELLCDTIIYDRKVLLKNLESSFCCALKKTVLSFVTDANEDNALLDLPPDLMDILTKLENKEFVATDSDVTHTNGTDKLWLCENLLNFLSTVPGFHANSKSFSQLINYILHLERLLLLAMLGHSYESSNSLKLLRLFFSLVPMVGTAYFALQKIADMSNWPDMFSLVCIDGILRYLEALGSFLTLPEINMSKELYTQNISGYAVTEDIINRQNRLNSLKSRLRLSLRKYVNVASNMHLNTALQVIERALVGVNHFSHSIYEINTGNSDGGAVSSDVAAGIDCLYMVLEIVPGNKRVVKRTVPGLVGALFNIVLHLQKHCSQGVELAASNEYILDRQFSVDMYASCCKLLCTTIRHQQREVARCVAVLEDSVNILLTCLESANPKMVNRAGYFSWNMEEAMKCASFFRRIYEEMRQQREILGKHSMYFLAGYISMYSGQGPFQTGITREMDEALRPGVYSLIDICEESDLQLLHTYLGEGPCRTTFSNLHVLFIPNPITEENVAVSLSLKI